MSKKQVPLDINHPDHKAWLESHRTAVSGSVNLNPVEVHPETKPLASGVRLRIQQCDERMEALDAMKAATWRKRELLQWRAQIEEARAALAQAPDSEAKAKARAALHEGWTGFWSTKAEHLKLDRLDRKP